MREKERLIQAWAHSLDDNAEMQLYAISALDEAIDEKADSLPELCAQLDHATANSRHKRRKFLWAFLILAILSMVWPLYQTVLVGNLVKDTGTAFGLFVLNQPLQKMATDRPEDSFLLYGNLSRSVEHEQQRALWDREPTDPVFFANYARHFHEAKRSLPPDFLKTATEIDPRNAWYLETAASVQSLNVCQIQKTIHPLSPLSQADIASATHPERLGLMRKVVHQGKVLDPTAMQEVLALWRQSLSLPEYDDHVLTLHQRRYPVLASQPDMRRHFTAAFYTNLQPSILMRSRDLSHVLMTGLQQADMHTEEGKALFRDIHAYVERLAVRRKNSVLEILIAQSILQQIYKQIDVIDISALDPAMVSLWRQRNLRLSELIDQVRQPSASDSTLTQHASLMTALALPSVRRQVLNPPPLPLETLTPMRYVDHCFILKIMGILFAVLLLSCLPLHVWAKRQRLIHRIIDPIWLSIPPGLLVRFTCWSVVLPLCYFIALTVFTPWTGKAYGPAEGFVFPCYPALAFLLVLLMLPRLLVYHFVTPWQKLHAHDQRWYLRIGWTACGLLLVPLHALPWIIAKVTHETAIITLLAVIASPAVLWLLWTFVRGWFQRDFYKRVMHGLRRRMTAVPTLATILLMSIVFEGLTIAESYWLKRDEVLAISPELPVLRFEAEITKIAHQELLHALEP